MAKKNNKSNKKTSSKPMKRFFVGLMLTGLLTVAIAQVHRAFYERSIKLQQEVIDGYGGNAAEDKVVPVRLKIWDMIDLPLELAPFINDNWVTSEDQGTYLGKSAGIGEPGNMIIYGHNRAEVLANIRVLRGGERMRLVGSDGSEYEYEVTGVFEVSPNEVSLLQDTSEHVLTMYTCSGWLDSKRFVVRAKLVSDGLRY